MVKVSDGPIAAAKPDLELGKSSARESAFRRLLGFANAQLGSETIRPGQLPTRIRASALGEAKSIYAGLSFKNAHPTIESAWVIKEENGAPAGYAVNLRLSGVDGGVDPRPVLFYDLSGAYLGWEHPGA